MDENKTPISLLMLYIGLAAGVLVLCFNDSETLTKAFVIYAVFIAQMLVHCMYYRDRRLTAGQNELILSLAIPTALAVQYFDHTGLTGFTVMVVIVDVLIVCRPKAASIMASAAFLLSVAVFTLRYGLSQQGIWIAVSTTFLPRIILIVTVILTRHSISVSARNRVLASSLQQKADELECALATLQRYTEELKETADLRAKDQLMRALHDQLGHMLATASISAQATVSLLERDPVAAKVRLGLVCEQIQSAMIALRSVLTGNADPADELEPFFEQFVRLASETQTRTGIPICVTCASAASFDALPTAPRLFLYHALMEGLTNGFRHGRATRFDCALTLEEGQLCFRLYNNGAGFADIRYGYGLSKIEKDARRLHGTLEMRGCDGCEMLIRLPLEMLKTTEAVL